LFFAKIPLQVAGTGLPQVHHDEGVEDAGKGRVDVEFRDASADLKIVAKEDGNAGLSRHGADNLIEFIDVFQA
jgi:hypothetical protein